MREAVDDWFLKKIHRLRNEDTVAHGIRWFQDVKIKFFSNLVRKSNWIIIRFCPLLDPTSCLILCRRQLKLHLFLSLCVADNLIWNLSPDFVAKWRILYQSGWQWRGIGSDWSKWQTNLVARWWLNPVPLSSNWRLELVNLRNSFSVSFSGSPQIDLYRVSLASLEVTFWCLIRQRPRQL